MTDGASRGEAHITVRWLAAGLALFAIQQFAIRKLGVHGSAAELRRAIFLFTTLALLAVLWQYRHYAGAWIIAAGISLNLLAAFPHGGLMPVSYQTVEQSGYFPGISRQDIGHQLGNGKDILLDRGDIAFEPLSDRYALSVPGYGGNVYSLGDFVLFAGLALVLVQAVGEPLLAAGRRRLAPLAH
jgi:hypothetical protein